MFVFVFVFGLLALALAYERGVLHGSRVRVRQGCQIPLGLDCGWNNGRRKKWKEKKEEEGDFSGIGVRNRIRVFLVVVVVGFGSFHFIRSFVLSFLD